MPLALLGEVPAQRRRRVTTRHLFWGTSLTLIGYSIFTLAVLVIEGTDAAASSVNPMVLLVATVQRVFGPWASEMMALCLGFYFLLIPVALHVCFSRLLVVSSLDGHISRWFSRLTTHRVPRNALVAQIGITLLVALVVYFVVPYLFPGNPSDLSSIAYNVLGASLLLVWAVSFLFPFLDMAVLTFRARTLLVQSRLCALPILVPLLLFSAVSGCALCLAALFFTMMNSFIPTLLPNTTWWYTVGGIALICLMLFALLSALTNSEARWESLQG